MSQDSQDESNAAFDGTVSSWHELDHNTGVFSWGGAVLLLGIPWKEAPQFLANCHVAMRYSCRADNSRPTFQDVVTFLPAEPNGRFWERIVNQVQTVMKENHAETLAVLSAPWVYDCRTLLSLQSEDILEHLAEIPPGSCCIITGAELFRFYNVRSDDNDPRPRTIEQIVDVQVQQFIESLITVAVNRSLTIIVFCDIERVRACEFWSSFSDRQHCMAATFHEHGIEPALVNLAIERFTTTNWAGIQSTAEDAKISPDLLGAAVVEALVYSTNDMCAAVATANPKQWSHVPPELLVESTRILIDSKGDLSTVKTLLNAALNHPRTLPLEDLASGFHAADLTNLPELCSAFRKLLVKLYAGNRVTAAVELRFCYVTRQFPLMVAIAEYLEDPFLITEAKALACETLRADQFLNEADKLGKREHALIECAQEAILRRGFRHAIIWCRQISEHHPLFRKSFALRVEALSQAFERCRKGLFVTEFTSLCGVAAHKPQSPTFRETMLWLVEHGMEEPAAQIVLAGALVHASRQQQSTHEAVIANTQRINQRRSEQARQRPGDFDAAFDEFLSSLQGQTVVIGESTLSPLIAERFGFNAISEIAQSLENPEVRNETISRRAALHLLVHLSSFYSDPTADLSALQTLAAWLSVTGNAQEARDLAETALQQWTQTQPAFASWRTTLGWLISGDSFLRSGNSIRAALCAYFAFLTLDGPALEAEFLLQLYRLCGRILRDFGFAPFADAIANVELSLIMLLPNNGMALHRHKVFRFQVAVAAAISNASENDLFELLKVGDDLLQVQVDSERAPLLSMQANLVRKLGISRIPAPIRDRFTHALNELPVALRLPISGTATAAVSRTDLAVAIQALSRARYSTDLSFQISPALPLACNALASAHSRTDSDLFLLAAGLLSQPALTAKINEKRNDDALYSFDGLLELQVNDLQRSIRDDEAVILVTGERGTPLYTMILSSKTVGVPSLVPENIWSNTTFNRWSLHYLKSFEWRIPKNIFDPILPSAEEVFQQMDKLEIPIDAPPENLTIIPATHLFGFTFNLAKHGKGFLGDATSISIAPSASWFVQQRTKPAASNGKRRAWIGSRHTKDITLHVLRARIEAVLEKYGFDISREDEPDGFENSDIALIGAHGGTGMFDYFQQIGDRVIHLDSKTLGAKLQNTQCAILAVCSSGKSDAQHGSEEALGAAATLLRFGVRCVIAPPWPMLIDVMDLWLPNFLEALDHGFTVSEAFALGRDGIKHRFDHPLATLQLHVFGDAGFRFDLEN